MTEEEKYRDFIDLSDTSEKGLYGLFAKRSLIRYMKSQLKDANQISITHFAADGVEINNPDATSSSYDDRLKVLNLLDKHEPDKPIIVDHSSGGPFPASQSKGSAAVQFPFHVELEFAKEELRYLNIGEIEDPFLAKRVEAYLRVCRDVIRQNNAKNKKDTEALKLSDLNNRELAAYFFYNRIDITRSNIERIIKEHGIDREIKKPTDIVENLHQWEKWSDNTRWRYGKNASKSQRQHLNNNYQRVRRFLTGPALAFLIADYETFCSCSPKK